MSEFFFNLNAEKGFQTMIQNLEEIKQNTGISYCTSDIVFLFYKLKGLWQLHVELVSQCHLSNSICPLHVSVPHFGILPYFKFFSICYGDLRSVAFDDIIVIAFRCHEPCYVKWWTQSAHSLCGLCSQGSTDQGFPSLTLLRFLCSETQQYWN